MTEQKPKKKNEVIADPHARYFGTELSERSLVPGDGALLGKTRFEDWLIGATANPPATAAAASKAI